MEGRGEAVTVVGNGGAGRQQGKGTVLGNREETDVFSMTTTRMEEKIERESGGVQHRMGSNNGFRQQGKGRRCWWRKNRERWQQWWRRGRQQQWHQIEEAMGGGDLGDGDWKEIEKREREQGREEGEGGRREESSITVTEARDDEIGDDHGFAGEEDVRERGVR